MKQKLFIGIIIIFSLGLLLALLYSLQAQSTLKLEIESYKTSESDLKNKIDELENELKPTDGPVKDITPLPESVILNIPGYKQRHNASCEFAATSAALKYFGKNFTEEQIFEFVGADTSPRFFDEEGILHWGNPQEKYVGDIDAKVVYVDGYGVYNKPIYRFLENNGFSKSVSKTDWELDELLNYVRKGLPAIVWISNDYLQKEVKTMIASDGAENPWIDKEHAVVIRGVDKDKIYIMDVGYGSQYTVTYTKFSTGFKNLNNMGIVVIPD